MKRILIDARFLGIGQSMTRYILEVIGGILRMDKENDYTLLIRPQGEKLADQLLSNQLSVISDQKTDNGKPITKLKLEVLDIPHYSLAEQTKLLKYLNKEKFDLVHFIQFNHPVRYRSKYIVTIHDLTLLGHLHRMGTAKKVGFNVVMKSAVKNSARIITVSNTTKDDVVSIYKADPKKITPIPLGVDDAYNSRIKNEELRIKKFKEKYGISGDYILYTGMWKRHKNILRMLKAFELVISNRLSVDGSENRGQRTEKNLQLVFVGKPDLKEPEVIAEIERINNSLTANSYPLKAILTTGFIDEEELPTAYAGALAYCFPSLSEGFGLTSLEAMACGTPVISSNASCMPEIYGDAAYYFDPLDVDDIAKAIEKISTDEKLRQELSQKGIEQAAKYDWSKTAKETFEVYKKVLSE